MTRSPPEESIRHPGRHPVQREYSRLAREYDERWAHYVRSTLRETMKRLDIHPGVELLDIGCGTGVLLETLDTRHHDIRLTGVDPTQEMLDVARRRLSSRVRLEQSWGEDLPFETGSFDVVVSCNVFHYMRRPAAALKEMRRVLRPSGRLLITDWCDDYLACKVCDVFLRWFSEAHFRTYTKKECKAMLSASGFSDIEVDSYKVSWLWGMMTAVSRRSDDAPRADKG